MTIWVFVKLLVLVVGVCRNLAKIDQEWMLIVYVAHNNPFIEVFLSLPAFWVLTFLHDLIAGFLV